MLVEAKRTKQRPTKKTEQDRNRESRRFRKPNILMKNKKYNKDNHVELKITNKKRQRENNPEYKNKDKKNAYLFWDQSNVR